MPETKPGVSKRQGPEGRGRPTGSKSKRKREGVSRYWQAWAAVSIAAVTPESENL